MRGDVKGTTDLDRAADIAWASLKLIDPKVNEKEMKVAMRVALRTGMEALAQPTDQGKDGWRAVLRAFVDADEEARGHGGLKDGRDNTGAFYQSAFMECLIDKAAKIAAVPSAPPTDCQTSGGAG